MTTLKKKDEDMLLDDFDIDFGDDNSDSLSDLQFEEEPQQEPQQETQQEPQQEPQQETQQETLEYQEEEPVMTQKNVSSIDLSKEENIQSTPDEGVKKDRYVLYIVSDKVNYGMIQYFRSYGVNVYKVFSNINDVRDVMLMQLEPSRLVVIETGTGKFTSMASRKALVDLMGLCDEDTKISVFYTDSVVKSEVIGSSEVNEKNIRWHKYRSTIDVLAHLLQNTKTEEYIYDTSKNEEVEITEDILNMRGLKSIDKDKSKAPKIEPILTLADIITHLDTGEKIEGYSIVKI